MDAASTQDALNLLLEGHQINPTELEEFTQRFHEDQYLDYKDGAITTKGQREHGRKTIREYVSAFANSDGGILIVGVSDGQPRGISPCERPGNEPLDKWAEGLLFDIAPKIAPPPRIQVVEHPTGPVLVIAVARAGEFIPCVEKRQLKYFLRFNQSTREAQPFLISDLLLGRRQHPVIELTAKSEGPPPYSKELYISINFDFSAENISLMTAEQLEVGIVSWVASSVSFELNAHLLPHLDLIDGQENEQSDWSLRHTTTRPKSPEITRLTAFNRVRFEPSSPLIYPFLDTYTEIVAAIYLLAKGSPPQWFELQFRCSRVPDESIGVSRPIISNIIVTKVIGKRPRVLHKTRPSE